MTPSRPYLLRALYEWLTDNGLTPHIVVDATVPHVKIPREHVQNGQIVLNVTATAVQKLMMTNDSVQFSARFPSGPKNIVVPIEAVTAIYARENGAGMMFGPEDLSGDVQTTGSAQQIEEGGEEGEGGGSSLTLIKNDSSASSTKSGKKKPQLKIIK